MYFENSKTIPANYTLKDKDITFDIDITTISLDITNNEIKIIYLVNDSNNKYEYYIVRSE